MHSLIRQTLPELIYASDNARKAVKSRSRWPFPAFMVLERGVSLSSTCVAVFFLSCHLASQ